MERLAERTEIVWNDEFATKVTGIKIEQMGHEWAECSLEVEQRHCNAAGNVMGGVLFTLADLAFAVAANNELIEKVAPEELWMTLDSTIHYLRKTHGKRLTARAKCIKNGAHICLYEVKITDDEEKLIATIESTGIRSTKK